jgi:hypothetical protein
MADGRGMPPGPTGGGDEQPTDSAWVSSPGEVRSRRFRLIVLLACVCVIAAGVSTAVLSSGGRQGGHIADAGNGQAATQTPQPSAAAASSPAATRPTVTGGTAANSALRRSPRLEHRLLRWRVGRGGAALSAVEKELGTAMQSAGVRLYATMRLSCVSLALDIRTAQAGPPIPDAAQQRLYARALAGLSGAAADCRNAISMHSSGDESVGTHVHQALLSQSRAEFAAMSTKLYVAVSGK